MTAKPTASDRRYNFLAEAQEPIVAAHRAGTLTDDSPVYAEVAHRIATEGPALGRTARWQEACAFFATEHNGSWSWTVRQGCVWAAYAAE